MLRSTALGLALLLFAGWPAACAQAIYPPINTPVFRALDANGKPLSGGKLYTYVAGSSTPQSTYADPAGTSPNTNPVILDSTGSAKIFLAPQNYKFILQDANGVQQWTVDNITGALPQSDVNSVFGRKGNVVAVAGDYTCSQITGAVCSIPTIYYQTIRAGGTDLTQRAKLNLIAGSNVNVTCSDNAGGNSTDCTFAYAGGSGPSRTCNENGCYIQYADGTIDAWGRTNNAPGGGSIASLTATFPTFFSTTTNLEITISPIGAAIGDGNPHPIECHVDSFTASGLSAYISLPTQVGGSGYDHLSSSQYCSWHAKGR